MSPAGRSRGSRQSRRKQSSRSSLKGLLLGLLIAFLLVIALWNVIGRKLLDPYIPSRDRMEASAYFGTEEGQVCLFLDDERLEGVTGIFENGGIYLPYSWVRRELSTDFYYSAPEKLLSHASPSEIRDFREKDRMSGKPAFLLKDEPYLLLELVEKYTDVNSRSFTADPAACRLYLMRGGRTVETTNTVRKAALRQKGGNKAPILTDLKEGEQVVVLEVLERWSRLRTSDGFIGYAENRVLSEARSSYTYPHGYRRKAADFKGLKKEKLMMGWHLTTSSFSNAYMEQFYENTGGRINAISPTWIQLSDAEGNYLNLCDGEYVKKAHALGMQVYACVDNFNQPGGLKEFDTGDFFESAEKRRGLIERLMKEAGVYGLDGFNLDFEGLSSSDGAAYGQFFKELAVACHEKDLALSIDDPVPFNYNTHYQMADQADYADYVIVMCYDEHTAGTDVGSVASLSYTDYAIEESLKSVPKERLVAALPFYTRIWTLKGSGKGTEVLGIKEARKKIQEYGITLNWDEVCAQYYGEANTSEGLKKVWMEEERSLTEKMKLVRAADLCGAALWRLNYEPPEVWPIVDMNAKE